ncbi:unnamed protein product [Durusdinium trenchii]|uniref:RING-type domain-containing protein n=2 Tax=Durusdinium trenchii TaxID=1381693 RepID=A0ABP0R7M8_9DINO
MRSNLFRAEVDGIRRRRFLPTLPGSSDLECAAGWQKLLQAAGSFFETDAQNNEDPLVETVRQQPVAALRFIRMMLLSSSLGSLVVCAVCWAFLYLQWSVCCSCQRPLRWWLLLYATLQQLQLPVRFVTLYRLGLRLQLHEADGERLQVEVSRFTSSMAWRWSKNISLFTYGWFVLGIVWVLNSDYESCREAHRITIAVIGQAFLRAVGAMLCFRLCMQAQPADSPKVEAARADEIASLPVVAFRSEMAKEHAMCSVCLSDYVEGEALRRLPCGHLFHRRCADEWLHRSCRCPLCVQSIRDF